MSTSVLFLTFTFSDAMAAPNDQNSTVIPDVSIEDSATPVREGDAKTTSRLVIDNSFIDPDNSCELCTRMVYTPGSIDEAGIAYKDENVDLGDTQRIVFFAKGEQAQEVSFVAAGNSTSSQSTNDTDMFPKIDFAIATQNVTLDDDWKRFEIGVNSSALSDASYPFGVQMTADSPQKQTFYIKGVTADSKPAADPLPTVLDSLNSTSTGPTENMTALSNTTQPLMAKIDANSTSSPAPATIEFTANATGGLGPYSLSWDFNDGGRNNTDVAQKVLHTFDKSGDYNVTLAVRDSGSASQNASATMLVNIGQPENKTALSNSTQSLPFSNVTMGLGNSSSFVHTNDTTENNNDTTTVAFTNSTVNSSATGVPMDILNIEQNTSQIELGSARFANSTAENVSESSNNKSSTSVTNHAPVAGDQIVVLTANETASIVLKGSDQDNDPITFQLMSHPTKGSITGFDKKTGYLSYVPDASSAGSDSFRFKVIDIQGAESNVGRVFQTVNPVQQSLEQNVPSARDVTVATSKNHPVAIVLMAKSEQNVDELKFSIATNPSHGKLSKLSNIGKESASVTYYPDEGYSGSDVFKFNVDETSTGSSTPGKVSITVIGDPPVENPSAAAITENPDENPGDTRGDSAPARNTDDVIGNQNLTSKSKQESSKDRSSADESGQTAIQSDNPVNHEPRAYAGPDLTVNEGSSDVTLKGAAKDSDGDRLSYSWEQIGGDPVITLVDVNTAKTKFDAPEVDGDEVLTFRLTVADENGGQAEDSVRIHVKDKLVIEKQDGQNKLGSDNPVNHEPRAYAGPDLTVNEGSSDVTLKGAAKDSDGDRLSYSWEQIGGDPVITLVDVNTAKTKFDAPEVDGDEVLTFRLTVADENGGQAADSVRIHVKDKLVIEKNIFPGQTESFRVFNQTSISGY